MIELEIILVIVICLLLLAAMFYWSVKRGQKTVRAYAYLCSITDELSINEANELVGRLDVYAASNMHRAAMEMVKSEFGGSQLKLISYARLHGYR